MTGPMYEIVLILVGACCVFYLTSFFIQQADTAFVFRLVIAIIAVVLILRALGVWHW